MLGLAVRARVRVRRLGLGFDLGLVDKTRVRGLGLGLEQWDRYWFRLGDRVRGRVRVNFIIFKRVAISFLVHLYSRIFI